VPEPARRPEPADNPEPAPPSQVIEAGPAPVPSGLAEDPGTNESFGMSRCRLVAEALWQAASSGQHSEPQRIEAIRTRFAQAGIAPDRPWLSPGSRDQYDVRID